MTRLYVDSVLWPISDLFTAFIGRNSTLYARFRHMPQHTLLYVGKNGE